MKYMMVLVGLSLTLASSCKKGEPAGEEIPNTPVSLQVNLDLPAYFDLTILGNWVYFPDGFDGIIVYHGFDGDYYAFDRACSFEPFKDCSQLWIDSTTRIHMNCGSYDNGIFTKCCDSRYEIPSGFPVEGPAQRAMKQYFVNRSGNTLFISN